MAQKDTELESLGSTHTQETQPRMKVMTSKGVEYRLDLKRKNIRQSVNRLKKVEISVHKLLEQSDIDNYDSVRSQYTDWMIIFEDILKEREEYGNLIDSSPDCPEHVDQFALFNDQIEVSQAFKENVNKWMQEMEKQRMTQIMKEQRDDTLSRHSKHSSKSFAFSISAARIKEAQKRAELMAKTAALKQKEKLEQSKLLLKMQEERLAISTEIAINEARCKVLDDIEHGTNGGHSDRHISVNTKPLQVNSHLDVNTSSALNNDENYPLQPEATRSHPERQHDNIGHPNSVMPSVIQQLRKPMPEIAVFSGNPLDYQKFMCQFKTKVLMNTTDNDERMNYLEQFTSGKAKKIVSSYVCLDANTGFPSAMKELEERYGDEDVIVNAFISKALDWPIIKADSLKCLDDYTVFLTECNNAVGNSSVLDNTENIRRIVSKLPYRYQEAFRSMVQTIRDAKSVVTFEDLVRFIRRESKKVNDPVFGKDALQQTCNYDRGQRHPKAQGKKLSLVTHVDPMRHSDHNRQVDPIRHSEHKQPVRPKQGNEPPSPNKGCKYCDSDGHAIPECSKFRLLTHEQKRTFVQSNGLCFRCLKYGHIGQVCRGNIICSKCQSRHNTLFHIDVNREGPDKVQASTLSSALNSDMGVGIDSTETCTMVIIPVTVCLKEGIQPIETYAFLDPGSSSSFCTESLMTRLGASGKSMKICINSMGEPRTLQTFALTGIKVGDLSMTHEVVLPKVYTVDKLPVTKLHIPTTADVMRWPHLSDNDIPNIDSEIEILIGNNVPNAYTPLEIRTGPDQAPHATKTRLGWALWNLTRHGTVDECTSALQCIVNRAEITAIQECEGLKELDHIVRQSYDTDFPERLINDEKQHSQEDRLFLQKVDESVRFKDGHYVIALPFRKNDVCFPNNYNMAMKQLMKLRKRLEQNESFRAEYTAFMNKMFEKGYSAIIPDDELEPAEGHVWYIPHHGVYHPKKGKIRVVFNCAAEYDGISFNSQLLSGPDLTNNLLGVLLRFRQERYAAIGDIESMFYQVRVAPEHLNFQRFLWWQNGDYNQPPVKCRMKVHMFGTTSSPSCANAALLRTASDHEFEFDPKVADIVRNNFYVDDCLMSDTTVEEAANKVEQVSALCARGGFRVTKWMANDAEVLSKIPARDRTDSVKDVNFDLQEHIVERALGVTWTVLPDLLGFRIDSKSDACTRRKVLSVVSSVYDPLGFASPFTLKAKLLLQEMCQQGINWDDELPAPILNEWQNWISELAKLADISVPRCYKPSVFSSVTDCQLHIFCDASSKGYGVTIYFRLTDRTGSVHCSMILAKSRVTPLKKVTIPRLELTAACVGVRVGHTIKKEIQYAINSTFFWTDSIAVLRYLNNDTSRYKTFVANRIAVIRDGSAPEQWRYVPTQQNPADAASRGLNMSEFQKIAYNWFHGPTFLWKPESEWPTTVLEPNSISADDPEIKKTVNTVMVHESNENAVDKLLNYFSSWSKLKRAVAWYQLFFCYLRMQAKGKKFSDVHAGDFLSSKKELQRTHGLNVEDVQSAEKSILRYVQQVYFPDLRSALNQECPLPVVKQIKKLDLFVVDGLIRVGGRLRRSSLPFDNKHPLLLPKQSRVSYLIVEHVHGIVGHMGRAAMMANLRQQYWILGLGHLIKRITSTCVICRKYRAKQVEQKMADLPVDRITPNEAPFSRVGVDYFGPFIVKRGRSSVKRYGVVFSCLNSRAVHLEVATSLDTTSCINAFRRFFARRGFPQKIWSDNGTNLVGCKNELMKSIKEWNTQQINQSLLKNNITWEFNPPMGSHHGGAWERMIRTIRKILYSILQSQVINLSDEGLQTLFCEAEAIINSRPITTVSSDIYDVNPLTPNHLLMMKSGEVLPPGIFSSDDCYTRRKWRQIQYLANLFWQRWSKEYLTMMQERQKWTSRRRNVSINDIVLIMDNLPRNAWCLGCVQEVFADSLGFVRSVKVKTQHSVLTRPVDKLCVILGAKSCDN